MRYLTVGDVIAFNQVEVGSDGSPTSAWSSRRSSAHRRRSGASTPTRRSTRRRPHSCTPSSDPFVDGNKRTAVVATFTFYLLNGWEIRAEPSEVVGLAVDVAEGHLDVAAIAKRLAGWAIRIDLPDE